MPATPVSTAPSFQPREGLPDCVAPAPANPPATNSPRESLPVASLLAHGYWMLRLSPPQRVPPPLRLPNQAPLSALAQQCALPSLRLWPPVRQPQTYSGGLRQRADFHR